MLILRGNPVKSKADMRKDNFITNLKTKLTLRRYNKSGRLILTTKKACHRANDDRLYIRFSAASYSPTKLPWQYHRR